MKNGGLVILVLIVVGGLILLWKDLSKHQELQSKREWSVLQAVELEQRARSISNNPIIITNEGCVIAGLLSEDKHNRIWLLLNPRFEPFVKQIPEGDFWITEKDFEMILKTTVHRKVLDTLKMHLSPRD